MMTHALALFTNMASWVPSFAYALTKLMAVVYQNSNIQTCVEYSHSKCNLTTDCLVVIRAISLNTKYNDFHDNTLLSSKARNIQHTGNLQLNYTYTHLHTICLTTIVGSGVLTNQQYNLQIDERLD